MGNVNPFSPELIQTLVSTVSAEVTKQLSILLPTQPATGQVVRLPLSPSTMPPTSTRRDTQSELPGVNGGSLTNLVNEAIASAHASISGEPQLLPTTKLDVPPTQFFSIRKFSHRLSGFGQTKTKHLD